MNNMQQSNILDSVTNQVQSYSADRLDLWRAAQASWSPEVRAWLCRTLTALQRSDLMQNRVAKLVCYSGAPSNNKPVLVFGQIRPGGRRFINHTNRLIVHLNGRSVHMYDKGVTRRASVLRFEEKAEETRAA